jgi:hypothetical protein
LNALHLAGIRCPNFVDARPGEARLGFAHDNFKILYRSSSDRSGRDSAAVGGEWRVRPRDHGCGFT